MKRINIIEELKKSGLKGRSGSGFPTGLKWEIVRKANGDKKFIVCNVSEGEPNVFKDIYILKKYPRDVIKGIKLALDIIDNSTAYLYLREDYYKKFKKNLIKLIGNAPIKLFKEIGGYLAGEETVLINAIEHERLEPNEKPPYPTEKGLFGYPTLINNLETFYYVSKIAANKYMKTRFYSISGDVRKKCVYEYPENWTIKKILQESGNWPKFDFFVQVGGGGIGEILMVDELNREVGGAGAIVVYNIKKIDLFVLMKKWTQFILAQNCDKCVPCREGVYRIDEMIDQKKIDQKILDDLFFVMDNTSFCPLGRFASLPFKGLLERFDKIEKIKKRLK